MEIAVSIHRKAVESENVDAQVLKTVSGRGYAPARPWPSGRRQIILIRIGIPELIQVIAVAAVAQGQLATAVQYDKGDCQRRRFEDPATKWISAGFLGKLAEFIPSRQRS